LERGTIGEAYNVGSDHQISILDLAKLVIKLSNSNSSIKYGKRPLHDHSARLPSLEKIKSQISENNILLYMKGSPKLPSCGFSSQASQALMQCGAPFAYVDILQNPDIRAELPKYADWPTFPQLWIKGELIGGCDIILEMFQQGELQTMIKEVAEKTQ
jgi:monothiol glutaredoxin